MSVLILAESDCLLGLQAYISCLFAIPYCKELKQCPLDALDPLLLALAEVAGRKGMGADVWPVWKQV